MYCIVRDVGSGMVYRFYKKRSGQYLTPQPHIFVVFPKIWPNGIVLTKPDN